MRTPGTNERPYGVLPLGTGYVHLEVGYYRMKMKMRTCDIILLCQLTSCHPGM